MITEYAQRLWNISTAHFLDLMVAVICALVIKLGEFVVGRLAKLAASLNTNFARRRIKHRLDRYARLWRKRERFRKEPYLAALKSAQENLYVQIPFLGFIGSGFTNYAALHIFRIGILVFVMIYFDLLRRERSELLKFEWFTGKTQQAVLSLRGIANDDQQLIQWWKIYFDKIAPFAAQMSDRDEDKR